MKTIAGKVPSGSAHGSGRLGAGICSWGKGTESKLTNRQRFVALGNPAPNDNPWPYNNAQRSPVLAVVGDISCQPGAEANGEAANEACTDSKNSAPTPTAPYTSTSLWQSQEATANQIEAMKPDAVALLGDLQYQVGRYSDFEKSFDLTYGAFKFLQRPAPGNHEFYDEHGETGVAGYGYFSYYNGFLIDTNAMPIRVSLMTTTISDPCPSNPACGPRLNRLPLTSSPNPFRGRMDRRGTSSWGRTEDRTESESEMAGTPTISAPGTLFRSI